MPNTKGKDERVFSPLFCLVLLIFAAAVMVTTSFIGSFAVVSGDSMNPTLEDGDLVWLNKLDKEVSTYDIIALRTASGKILIKRVIGVPGDTIQIIQGALYVNGKLFEDVVDIEIEDPGMAINLVTLGENEYFVLGDNRNNSRDSRSSSVGPVNFSNIIGTVNVSLLPPRTLE